MLKKFGVEIFDPTNEPFDPHRHNAVFQVPDGSKPPGTVAAVLKVCLVVMIIVLCVVLFLPLLYFKFFIFIRVANGNFMMMKL